MCIFFPEIAINLKGFFFFIGAPDYLIQEPASFIVRSCPHPTLADWLGLTFNGQLLQL